MQTYSNLMHSLLVCASAALDSDDAVDPKIDLILRVKKILKNLTVAPPVCF